MLISTAVAAQSINPLEGDMRAVGAGAALFRAQCATCHGADAKGIEGIEAPDLTLLWSRPEHRDADVFQTIRQGVPGSIMPPHGFNDTETWMLVAYLESINPGANSVSYSGNADRGAGLFADHCSECHRAGNQGGVLGPDLSRITRMRSRDALVRSIREPGATVGSGYQPVQIVTADGENIAGLVKTEDAFTIQVMDADQNLRAFSKQSLDSLSRPDDSLMPVFGTSMLGEDGLEDILTYLDGLARGGNR